jgi:hypothetical protein
MSLLHYRMIRITISLRQSRESFAVEAAVLLVPRAAALKSNGTSGRFVKARTNSGQPDLGHSRISERATGS